MCVTAAVSGILTKLIDSKHSKPISNTKSLLVKIVLYLKNEIPLKLEEKSQKKNQARPGRIFGREF